MHRATGRLAGPLSAGLFAPFVSPTGGRWRAGERGAGRACCFAGVPGTVGEAARPGPEGVHPLLNGDLLIVHDAAGIPVWIGTVEFDFETGLQHDPLEPSSMRQAVSGYWVHGFQKGEDPELWARMFFEHRRAIVKR